LVEVTLLFKTNVSWKDFRYSASFDFKLFAAVHQPMLKVKLSNGSLPFPTEMLVDSGAHHTLVDADVATVLEIDIKKCLEIEVGGITGSTTGYKHQISIDLIDLKDVFPADVIFVPKLGTSGILGQDVLFKRYNVKFEGHKLAFYLEKVPKLKF
jgi:hypothetical protein